MGSRHVRQHCQLSGEGNGYLEHAMEEMNFSAQAHERILKVARTLADLSGSPDIRPNDILEAIQVRPLDRKLGRDLYRINLPARPRRFLGEVLFSTRMATALPTTSPMKRRYSRGVYEQHLPLLQEMMLQPGAPRRA